MGCSSEKPGAAAGTPRAAAETRRSPGGSGKKQARGGWGTGVCAHYLDCGMVSRVCKYPSHMVHVTHTQFLLSLISQ